MATFVFEPVKNTKLSTPVVDNSRAHTTHTNKTMDEWGRVRVRVKV